MNENNTFYFLNHKMLDLDERQQELYRDMLKNHGEKIYTLYIKLIEKNNVINPTSIGLKYSNSLMNSK